MSTALLVKIYRTFLALPRLWKLARRSSLWGFGADAETAFKATPGFQSEFDKIKADIERGGR